MIGEVRRYLRANMSAYVERMMSLLGGQHDPLTSEYAAMSLRNMCEEYSAKSLVAASEGTLAALVEMLSSVDADAVYNSLGAIEKLMCDYEPRRRISTLGGIEPILSLIKSEYPQIQELAFSSLAKLLQNGKLSYLNSKDLNYNNNAHNIKFL
jgi:hypothetical protein